VEKWRSERRASELRGLKESRDDRVDRENREFRENKEDRDKWDKWEIPIKRSVTHQALAPLSILSRGRKGIKGY
jgi:hypothetical protein